ncbi:MAG TPA: MoxR family ATPase [Firmicutes bacterium]|nr:MoxR family ATPase [Bacillota bacterium]
MNPQEVQAWANQIEENIALVIVGKTDAIELLLVALLCEGHILVEDVPGVGKTMLARSLAASLGCKFSRIQFTPDLLPSDITGVSVFNQKTNDFEFRPGPVMSQILLADEVNRATPRTQSSLLEAMEERTVTVDGTTYPLPRPFLVIATQNPVEYEGTFPLPEAQLDRFFLRIELGYPTEEEEHEILLRLQRQHPIEQLTAVTDQETIRRMQQVIKEIYVEESVRQYIVNLVRATRQHRDIALGVSPRGTLALFKASQALAGIRGRDYVIPDDVKTLAINVLAHRIILRSESQLRGTTDRDVIADLLNTVAIDLEK